MRNLDELSTFPRGGLPKFYDRPGSDVDQFLFLLNGIPVQFPFINPAILVNKMSKAFRILDSRRMQSDVKSFSVFNRHLAPPQRLCVFGETSTGKYLACVFEYLDTDQVIPVTAYEIE